ncbi:Tif3p KNAG_0D05280 [Huiozyma naganishii CBS 8797]|uniref:RRM domain-containing protein n=1 Tax=Huiozyma naganishii (strain ATCC MYA-139 / BCRC 22969 / CBS 8797 / KCTC 17520 / NBRC 10181 / NCYC 3082 / Yp74L-3) TaxID=1071383 RepID=J7S7D7_HUIN7|nr:hypothetical protein KNAG_0D05280 [Kazachstania naganishii CBS 8797]CCK70266.1 hypothetical protein KNAG_0D05280 [Kazachstania naganishii CBS 8797]
MAPPKKTVKMDLNSFLNDDTFDSSWTEEDVDLNKINIPIERTTPANAIPLEEIKAAAGGRGGFGRGDRGFGGGDRGFGYGGGSGGASRLDPALQGGEKTGGFGSFGGGAGGSRGPREEYPVPNHPPYRAIINNIPWDISPEGVKAWVEDGLGKQGAVDDIDLPTAMDDPSRLKGMAFVGFKEREDLVTALTFNATKLNERTVYVAVAAPKRGGFGFGGADVDWSGARGSQFQGSGGGDEVDIDWGAARGSNFKASRPMRDEANLNWDAVRGSNFKESRAPREEANLDWNAVRGSNFKESRPPREEANLDWNAVRGSNFKESRPPREEANLDWNAVRGSNFKESRPPREEANLNWGAARGSQFTGSQRERQRQPARDEPQLDWGAAKGAHFGKKTQGKRAFPGKQAEKPATSTEEKTKIQKSAYEVLRSEDDDDEDDEESKQETSEKKDEGNVDELAQKTASLSVTEGDNDEWEVVGKK